MIRRIVGWLVLLPLCAVLVIFALANRETVSVSFDPFGTGGGLLPAIDIPLFVLIYALLLVGIVLGGFASWWAQGQNRRERRQFKRENSKLSMELEDARRQGRQSGTSPAVLDADDILDKD